MALVLWRAPKEAEFLFCDAPAVPQLFPQFGGSIADIAVPITPGLIFCAMSGPILRSERLVDVIPVSTDFVERQNRRIAGNAERFIFSKIPPTSRCLFDRTARASGYSDRNKRSRCTNLR
jgi:hypothetical protein